MLKRVLTVFSLAILMIACGCKESTKAETSQERYQRIAKEKQSGSTIASTSTSTSTNDDSRFIYDVDGVIFDKEYDSDFNDYYFYIKLEDGKALKWETDDVKFRLKEIGDSVHFDFLRVDRFSEMEND